MEFIKIPKVDKVRLLDNTRTKRGVDGTLYLTATHLIFVDADRNQETWIVHTHINSVEKLNLSTAGSPLVIRCKTFQNLTFMVAEERNCHDLYSSLLKLSKPVRLDDLYAFSYNPRESQKQCEGWDMFKLEMEFIRMGIPDSTHWKITEINGDFKLCDTYPQLLCVPELAMPSLLYGSASFRSKGRLPVLSYLHKNGAVISRCSQPLSGLNSRSQDDEAYVDLIRRSKPNKDDFMYIVDTRPRINAVANRAQGKGYENIEFYDKIKYHFLGIDNIHVMRASLTKLLEVCADTGSSMSTFLEGINSSGWLRHVHNVLQVSRFIAHAIGVEGRSVLVHCSDGWDRTAQTCSLAAIMLNPHYRTTEGFLALVQKEWLSFGHKFTDRMGHLERDPREVSPIFIQFIDAVWQLMRYRPAAFQFNELLLLDFLDHSQSCQFGTFLGNCERERIINRLEERTHSLWGWMWKRLNLYINPLYSAVERHRNDQDDLLLASTCPHAVRFWRGMYNRYEKGLHPRENIGEAISTIANENTLLQDTVKLLRKRLSELGIDSNQIENEQMETFPDTPLASPMEHNTLFPSLASINASLDNCIMIPDNVNDVKVIQTKMTINDDDTEDENLPDQTENISNTDKDSPASVEKVSLDMNHTIPDSTLTVSFSAKSLTLYDDIATDTHNGQDNTNSENDEPDPTESWEVLKAD